MDQFLDLTLPHPMNEDQVHCIMLLVLHPRHFWVSAETSYVWRRPDEKEEYWELFRGNLLPISQSRETVHFLSAGVYDASGDESPEEPLISLKADPKRGNFHVVRAILSRVWEGVETSANVIESRETARWVRELVGSVDAGESATVRDLVRELACLVYQAVVGTSRLPLTSLETPLPQFALGRLGYFFDVSILTDFEPNEAAKVWQHPRPMNSWKELFERMQCIENDEIQAKALELCCRSLPESDVEAAAEYWTRESDGEQQIIPLYRRMFNDVSLSPYTQFVERALRLLHRIEQSGTVAPTQRFDLLSYLLRWLCRHLTAYDLVTFHYRGANYPDALLLDDLLLEYCSAIHANAELIFARVGDDEKRQKKKRVRRRAFRQACIIRRHYENHLVPDVPTSPGENVRVLPEPFTQVPDDQILDVSKRHRRLYADDDLIDYLNVGSAPSSNTGDAAPGILIQLLQQSIDDLADPTERQEMGTAVFIDRPLGIGKQSPEPDQTPLFAYEAFSKTIALQRFAELKRLANDVGILLPSDLAESFDQMEVAAVPIQDVAVKQRPLASLADVARVSPDFVLIRTLQRGVREFYRCFDFESFAAKNAVRFPSADDCFLIIPAHYDVKPCLAIYDSSYQLRCELEIVLERGYVTRCAVELPAGGLRVLRLAGERYRVPSSNSIAVKPLIE